MLSDVPHGAAAHLITLILRLGLSVAPNFLINFYRIRWITKMWNQIHCCLLRVCWSESPSAGYGYRGSVHSSAFALAEWACRTADWFAPARMPGSCDHSECQPLAPSIAGICRLLQSRPYSPIAGQRCACASADRTTWQGQIPQNSWRVAPPILPRRPRMRVFGRDKGESYFARTMCN
jgi:hypothetical protein